MAQIRLSFHKAKVYQDLVDAVREASEHVAKFHAVNVFIIKEKDGTDDAYNPVYTITPTGKPCPLASIVELTVKQKHNVVAVFATIR